MQLIWVPSLQPYSRYLVCISYFPVLLVEIEALILCVNTWCRSSYKIFSQACTRKIERNNETESQEKSRMIHKYLHVLLINIVYINNTSLRGKIDFLRRQLMLAYKEGLLNMVNPHRWLKHFPNQLKSSWIG